MQKGLIDEHFLIVLFTRIWGFPLLKAWFRSGFA